MQKLTLNNGNVVWEKPKEFKKEFIISRINEDLDIEIVDENTIHLKLISIETNKNNVYCFLANDTSLNGVLYNNSEELKNQLIQYMQ